MQIHKLLTISIIIITSVQVSSVTVFLYVKCLITEVMRVVLMHSSSM